MTEVGWGNWLPGLGGFGNCPAITFLPLAQKGVVTLSVVEKSEGSQEDKTCIRKKTIGLQENETRKKDRKNGNGNGVKNPSQPSDG